MKIKTVLMTLMMLAGLAHAAESPLLIPFQGRLTDQNNVPYNSGQYTLTFNLYDEAVGGNSLWTERHQQVGVINGMVNVFLGSIEAMDSVDFSQTLYLGITIDADGLENTSDPEMIPRQMIIPAFHAKDSEKLAGYDWSAILEPGQTDPSTGSIKASKIETDGIAAGQIATGAVGSDEIDTGAVGSDEIVNESITSEDILDGQVAEQDLSQTLQDTLSTLVSEDALKATLKSTDNPSMNYLTMYFAGEQSMTGAWDILGLNVERNNIDGASVASGIITLPEGTYFADGWIAIAMNNNNSDAFASCALFNGGFAFSDILIDGSSAHQYNDYSLRTTQTLLVKGHFSIGAGGSSSIRIGVIASNGQVGLNYSRGTGFPDPKSAFLMIRKLD